MASLEVSKEAKLKGNEEHEDDGYTCDGSIDFYGQPAIRERSGKWVAGVIILLNQGLATLAFFGVGVNLVLFLTRVLQQNNAEAANSVSKWTGTVYIFSLVGAFLSDSYWGRFKTCAIFQAIFVIGLALFALTTQIFLLKPRGCGGEASPCQPHSSWEIGLFYISIYMIALGNGGYQPNIATFGADQFDVEDPKEGRSKVAFFSYFYLALNLGSLVSNTVLGYFEDEGMWALGFWASSASAFVAMVLFLGGTKRYRHFKPSGNPLSRFCQVIVAASKKYRVEMSQDLFQDRGNDKSMRTMMHTHGFKFLDRAALITPRDSDHLNQKSHNPWRLCPISQVEEVKCILRLIPIWLCTIIYSVVFTQMASLFVEQGDAMNTNIGEFKIPAASMSSFDILSVALFIFLYRRVIGPISRRIRKNEHGLTELQRMGIGLAIAVLAMVSSGVVEIYRLKYARKDCKHCQGSSSLSIFWQIPQYCLIGASEVFMYVGQLEFFNAQAPDGLKSFGSALCMTSISLGNYVSSLLVSIVMKISTEDHMAGWIPGNLNKGHLDRFYFLLAGLTVVDLAVYVGCAMGYRSIKVQGKLGDNDDGDRDCMSGGTEAFPDLGRHCQHEDCHQLDFLPFTCNSCRKVFCIEHRSYKSHDCPNSDVSSRKVVVCEVCSGAIETTGVYGEDEKKILEEHEKSGDCDPRKKKKPTCPVRRCKEVLTFSNNATCKSCGVRVCLRHRFPTEHACEKVRGNLGNKGDRSSNNSKFLAALSSRIGKDCGEDSNKMVKAPSQPSVRAY